MELIAIGRVKTAFGLTGELKVESFSGESTHFASLEHVRLGDAQREYAVESVRIDGGKLFLKLEGVDSPEAARRLARLEIWAERAHAAPLGADEYYLADLIGCELRYAGERKARVVASWESSICHMLEVECRDGSLRNVPFMSPYIGSVDVEEKQIELLVDWILE